SMKRIAIIGDVHKSFLKMLYEILSYYGIKDVFFIQINKLTKKHNVKLNGIKYINSLNGKDINHIYFDLAIIVIVSNNPMLNYKLKKIASKIKSFKTIFVNYNLEKQIIPKFWLIPVVKRLKKEYFKLKEDPKTFFVDLVVNVRRLLEINR
ncbi:MAG: hypothetical protein ACTSQG_11800, partial [Promethearchaeota archaeon]